MLSKEKLRIKYLNIRKKKYFEINLSFFRPFFLMLKKKLKKKDYLLAIYYPSNFEINVLKLFDLKKKNKIKTLIPSIDKKIMKFSYWKYKDTLKVNKFGLLEPIVKQSVVPDIILVPLVAFDNSKFRLGYGKGYYDRYLNKYLKKNKTIMTIGVAFSLKKYNKITIKKFDVKLDYILTEKGIQ
jgi:5-formyltetrahydrofolate cyclo-ligase